MALREENRARARAARYAKLMIYQLAIPPLDGVEELRVLQWHKKEGDTVSFDQLIVELETDKAIIEVRSPRPCILRKIAIARGEWTPAGPALAWLSDGVDEPVQTEGAADFDPHLQVT